MPTDNKNLSEILTQLMETENVSVEKLSSQTEIPSRFIIALREGEYNKLPAEPYVRGYLIKIAGVLRTESEGLIQAYKESVKEYKAKMADVLPGNKYAATPVNKGIVAAVLAGLAIIAFIVFRFNSIFGIPSLNVDIPQHATEQNIKIMGSVRPGDRLTLNGESIFVDDEGNFEKDLFLSPGLNTYEFTVRRFLGKETSFIKQIYFDDSALNSPSNNSNSTSPQTPPRQTE